ncbi:hypothetical protein PV10_05803 [Exophiala mesophila]|uniref:NAD(P)-binding protein n=1 Tax=Exophiala mesophila TaxID=212818 RepID=A0A0D1Z931_EXOME|nr:uncharacterized protein PV10_05803 [Exophiala mesophila]KIV91242.1 hypothetical protein PV10_05803 [Exophiala mesophila]
MSTPRFTNKLHNQRILLVGGTGGVGISVAQALIEYGATVILSSSRESKLTQVITSLKTDYPDASDRISGYACDLSSPQVEENIQLLFHKIRDPIDHIIYMAGDRLPTIPLDEITLDKWQKCNQVRTIAAILVVKIGSRYLKKQATSSITLTGGSISEKPIAGGWAMLALIGAGLNGLARQLAFDLAPIRVNCVAPGVIDTDLWRGMKEEVRGEFFKGLRETNPTGMVGKPEDLAEAYLYCLRDCNATGMVVHSNSGVFLV